MHGRANDPSVGHMGMGKWTKWVTPAEDRNQTKTWQGERLPPVQARLSIFLVLRQNARQKQLKEGLQFEGTVCHSGIDPAAGTQGGYIVSRVGQKR